MFGEIKKVQKTLEDLLKTLGQIPETIELLRRIDTKLGIIVKKLDTIDEAPAKLKASASDVLKNLPNDFFKGMDV